ncbi:MAG: hypothetical protein EOO51_10045 [Flavobacterium sp.]|nr:MAG: hypothetical protein EOO51_10045 [Flavobacterium sp.]
MLVTASKYLVPKGYVAITIFPFIILRNKAHKSDEVLLNHERIHLRQQLEMLVIPFFLWYSIEFLYHLVGCRDFQRAYRKIRFENEAYSNEKSPDYLKSRPFWNFVKY